MIEFCVPGRPRGKDRPRFDTRSGRAYTSAQTRAEEKGIAKLYQAAARGAPPISGPVRIKIIAIYEIPVAWGPTLQTEARAGRVWHVDRGDIDNIVKLVCDALNGLAWHDDRQIAILQAAKRYGAPERIEICIEALDQPDGLVTPTQSRLEGRIGQRQLDLARGKLGGRRKSSKAKL